MISIPVTPRIENALDSMTFDEIDRMDAAVTANDEMQVMSLLCAKDALILAELCDPILHAMLTMNVSWADMMDVMPASAKRILEPKVMEWEDNPDADWEMPILRLRKHIWENFPVDVLSIRSMDNVERYAIRWNPAKYAQARADVDSSWEYEDFDDNIHRRLLISLNASRYWTVEEAQSDRDVCVIAMNFQDAKPAMVAMAVDDAASVSSGGSWKQVTVKKTAVPELRRLNDIKAHFPVIWNEVQGCASTTYAIEIFGKKVKELGLNMVRVKADLEAALRASKAWNVLPAKDPKHVCLLQMKHA